MDEETKRKRIRNYFAAFPMWTVYALGIGILFLLIGLSGSGSMLIFGLLVGGIGGYGIKSYIEGKPSDQEMDTFLREDFQQLNNKSIKKMGIDHSEIAGETTLISGPILWNTNGISNSDLVYKTGQDELARFGIYRVTCVQLTDKLMGIYQCTFNFLKNVALNESTDEYFYRDVVAVSTKEESTSYALPNGEKLINAEKFVLTASSGDRVEVILKDPSLERLTGGRIPTEQSETAMQAIRNMLREKKS